MHNTDENRALVKKGLHTFLEIGRLERQGRGCVPCSTPRRWGGQNTEGRKRTAADTEEVTFSSTEERNVRSRTGNENQNRILKTEHTFGA